MPSEAFAAFCCAPKVVSAPPDRSEASLVEEVGTLVVPAHWMLANRRKEPFGFREVRFPTPITGVRDLESPGEE